MRVGRRPEHAAVITHVVADVMTGQGWSADTPGGPFATGAEKIDAAFATSEHEDFDRGCLGHALSPGEAPMDPGSRAGVYAH
jgi:hypothetical protein